VPFEVNAEDLL